MTADRPAGKREVPGTGHCAFQQIDAWAARAAKGDGDAWRSVFLSVIDRVYSLAYSVTGRNRPEAEDLTSDIMVAAATGLRRYDGKRGSFEAWLLGIARHHFSRYRRHKRRAGLLGIPPEGWEEALRSAESAEELLTRAEACHGVHLALAALSPRHRWLLERKYLDDWPAARIAECCGESLKAVESALVRARQSFRRELLRLSSTDPD